MVPITRGVFIRKVMEMAGGGFATNRAGLTRQDGKDRRRDKHRHFNLHIQPAMRSVEEKFLRATRYLEQMCDAGSLQHFIRKQTDVQCKLHCCSLNHNSFTLGKQHFQTSLPPNNHTGNAW